MSSFLLLPGSIAEDVVKLEKLAKKIGGKLEIEGLEPEGENFIEDLDINIKIKPLDVIETSREPENRYIEYITKNGKTFIIYPSTLEIIDVTEGKRVRIPKLSGIEYMGTTINNDGTITISFAPSFLVEEED